MANPQELGCSGWMRDGDGLRSRIRSVTSQRLHLCRFRLSGDPCEIEDAEPRDARLNAVGNVRADDVRRASATQASREFSGRGLSQLRRNKSAGLIRMARRAGSHAAIKATIINAAAEDTTVIGSRGRTS
jgi:hypothetical protein